MILIILSHQKDSNLQFQIQLRYLGLEDRFDYGESFARKGGFEPPKLSYRFWRSAPLTARQLTYYVRMDGFEPPVSYPSELQ